MFDGDDGIRIMCPLNNQKGSKHANYANFPCLFIVDLQMINVHF